MSMFSGKIGLVMGVANDRSIGWAIAQALYAEGAEMAFTHLPSPSNERRVRALVEPHQPKVVVPCGCSTKSAASTAGSIFSFTRSPSPRRKSCANPMSK